jgi:hypothetical protein
MTLLSCDSLTKSTPRVDAPTLNILLKYLITGRGYLIGFDDDGLSRFFKNTFITFLF